MAAVLCHADRQVLAGKRAVGSVKHESFSARRQRLLDGGGRRVASFLRPSPSEMDFEKRILRCAMVESCIDPGISFLDAKAVYDASALLPLLQRMPKGAVLHTHGIASGNFDILVDMVQRDPHFYVWKGDTSVVKGTIRSFNTPDEVGDDWLPASICSRDEVYSSLTLPPKLSSVKACWEEFGLIWDRIRYVANSAPLYFGPDGFLWSILLGFLKSNVMYVEIKEPISAPSFADHDGRQLTDEEWVGRYDATVHQFCIAHPAFIGARVVLACMKIQVVDDVREGFRRAVLMKRQFPHLIAGFDLVGPEDSWQPIEVFAGALEDERIAAMKDGIDLPLLLHAGETNMADATQIFDAVALGCERIGHGFSLARHPTLVDEVMEAGISLECCPISNQVLGYCPDLATHAALGLFRSGVLMHISSDDPGMWHYSDVSYDFVAVTKAWNLGVAELKALARNSLACSTLPVDEKADALAAWEKSWDKWIIEELGKIGVGS